jgi:hypothetical protein
MQIRFMTLALALVVGTAACSESNDPTAPIRNPVEFAMAAVNGNGVTGTVTIQDQEGPGATVTVRLQGLAPGSAHAGHVHVGSCAAQGAIRTGLEPITADAQGSGTATTTGVPDELLVAGFYVQYHVALTPPGDPISCGNVVPGAITDGGSNGGGY